VTARARLTALRLVGFKSFAERTAIEFGPGISAIVGPNGSGKSNLADALRWTLGEAGRSLRTRRSEDVIFAGSSTRRATSMADVTIVLENEDRLLPLDYGQVELGRRLFRSGENEYLLNRQRVRLRDLIELLDTGNLADNAFLFIGQGMVDQALALRPEERRPLFEEAAGVRRHERRRRQAEQDLAEAEANLERLRDVLAELRPQARRLAAQADQLQARRGAGHDLAEALVAAARGRWVEVAATAAASQAALARVHAAADSALAELRTAEEIVERLNSALAERADRERSQRAVVEQRRARTLEVRLELTRLVAEAGALERDRRRIGEERAAIAARGAEARLVLAHGPADATDDEAMATELERLNADLARARAERSAGASAAENARRAEAAWHEERERRLRRVAALRNELAALQQREPRVDEAAQQAVAARDGAMQRQAAAIAAAEVTEQEVAATRIRLDGALSRHAAQQTAVAGAEQKLAELRARAEALNAELAANESDALARAVRARGGQLLAEDVEVEPRLRLALAAALGEAASGMVVPDGAVAGLPPGRTTLVLADDGRPRSDGRPDAGTAEKAVTAARAAGGGALAEGLRRDPRGHVGRLVTRSLWVEELDDALAIRHLLPPGWQVVTVGGQCLTDQGSLRLASTDRFLRLREERAAAQAALATAQDELRALQGALAEAGRDRQAVETEAVAARAARDTALRELRQAEEAERAAQRRAEASIAERATVASRLADVRAQLAGQESGLPTLVAATGPNGAGAVGDGPRPALDHHIAGLETARDRVETQLEVRRAARRADDEARRRAEIAIGLDEVRGNELDRQAEELAGRLAGVTATRERSAAELEAAAAAETAATAELERLTTASSDDRASVADADRRAASARERLRSSETASRSAEVAAMEARLQLENQRETLLVELAAIGMEAMSALGVADERGDRPEGADVSADRLAAALDAAFARWQGDGGEVPPAPSVARIVALRRRFHELGAGNPFAAEEFTEVSARLESLEAQRSDLESAIDTTRRLIDDLNRLIADQFRTTFAALEGAFARRFSQLFDGGEAQLALTAPDDLSATGIEITARPPGKKRQPLQMLSGGERALTAVALLVAMLEVRPVPFCVLDEVDAALDEANIGRFAQALRSLAGQTQFIVITHNRGTIEAADALYGVTIGDDAVSRIVSLRLPPPSAEENGADGGTAAAALAAEEFVG